MPERSITPHPDVVDTELDGQETVLLHLGTKQYFSLNATGTVIWQALRNGLAPDDIARELQRRYDVTPEHASRSVTTLLDALVEQRLASRASEP
jgi:predicted Rdx family selenoprotein